MSNISDVMTLLNWAILMLGVTIGLVAGTYTALGRIEKRLDRVLGPIHVTMEGPGED